MSADFHTHLMGGGLPTPPKGFAWQAMPIKEDGPAPLPLTPEGGLDWELIKGEVADIRVAVGGYVEMTITGGGFTRRYAGFVKGKINITSKQCTQ